MEKNRNNRYEILSPVGDKAGFYMAIKSGADAVYMGLPKFNARLKAENITLEELPELVRYAHLKGVKVYITLNTILSTSEILDACELVGKCLLSGVDAFIVQDIGLISVLKLKYPGIVLHGSTQLGVHNVRGAEVAKSLGLSRVVLSRECTIEDIKAIADSVDIELEIFVQGAICVCFSGNCYISSLKHNASGNRGQCKQLCRLPYTLSDGIKSISGYTLSPRDNCMLNYLKTLCDIGVCSFKIEGRLRHTGYVGVATNSYRVALDSIVSNDDNGSLRSANTNIDNSLLLDNLKKVFSRAEYIPSYNESNNVIDPLNNNHMGVKIGTVLATNKFKDIYRITIQSSTPIRSGDGLKFVNNSSIQSMGVGNVDKNGNNYIVYGKNHVSIGSIVYKTLDSELENNIKDFSRKLQTFVYVEAICGNRLRVEYRVEDKSAVVFGDVCEPAKNAPMTDESFIKQLSKIDKDIYEIVSYDIVSDGVFIPVAKLNELRRECIAKLEESLLHREYKFSDALPMIKDRYVGFDSIAIVNEKSNLKKLASDYSVCIFSPTIYSIEIIERFCREYSKLFKAPLIINLPIIAMSSDLQLIDKIVSRFKSSDVIFIANNIYALSYVSEGARIWAGSGLNIMNEYSASKYLDMGCEEIIGSIEKWSGRLADTYKLTGNNVLMTFAHCPYKTLYNNDCSSCKYNGNLTLKSNVSTFRILRQKISHCYFELIEDRPIASGSAVICDVR